MRTPLYEVTSSNTEAAEFTIVQGMIVPTCRRLTWDERYMSVG
jgi:hypothetical protein